MMKQKKGFKLLKVGLGTQCIAIFFVALMILTAIPITAGLTKGTPQLSINEPKTLNPEKITEEKQIEKKVLEYSYTFSAPTPIIRDEGYILSIEGADLTNIPGKPIVPVETKKFLLPENTYLKNIEISPDSEQVLPIPFTIACGQDVIPLSYTKKVERTECDSTIYNSPKLYPGKLYEIGSVQYACGYPILYLNLYPLQYNPMEKKVTVYSTLNVKITLETSDKQSNSIMSYRMSTEDITRVKNMVNNPEILVTYNQASTPLHKKTGVRSLVNPAETYTYVIITNRALRDAAGEYTFHDLIQSKINKGLTATIVTVEDIEACPAYWWNGPFGDENQLFNDTACHIRNFIRDAYQNWGTQYILLGGDGDGANVGGESGNNIIPARVLYDQTKLTDGIVSDLYYACLDGSFDSNMNGTFGESKDGPNGTDIDLVAEVAVGRAPVDNAEQVSNFVHKTLAYENSKDDYLQNVLMVGEYLGFGGVANWGGNYKDEIKDGSNNNGYTTVGIPEMYNVSTLYDRDWLGHNWPKSELLTRINNGVHIINHLGHGNNFHVMKLDEPVLMREGVISGDCHDITDNLTNDQYFFMYSQACYSGSFDNKDYTMIDGHCGYLPYDCIAEHMVTAPHGAFACIANTRYGIGMGYSTDGPSQYFDREFFDALFGENIRSLGQANQDSKEDNIGRIDDWYIRFCYYEITLFGDPEISLKPTHNVGVKSIDAPSHVQSNKIISVTTTIANNGQCNESDVIVSFRVDNIEIATKIVPSLEYSAAQQVSFNWMPLVGVHTITINVSISGVTEYYYTDNECNQMVIVGVQNSATGKCFDTIQAVIDDVDTVDGHHIIVPPGVYRENLVVIKGVCLVGMEKETTIIDGGGAVAISITGVSFVDITGFTITNGTYGVSIHEGSQISIQDIVIRDNTMVGIFLSSANDTQIVANDIIGNEVGIYIDDQSRNSLIYHNNFNNTENAVDSGSKNQWNSSYYSGVSGGRLVGGNWWSDYEGEDLWKGPNQNERGSDGIGDTPYPISGGKDTDWYPLIEPWGGSIPITIYVDKNFTENTTGWGIYSFNTIQGAIDNANTGDTIFVFKGTYSEDVIVQKTIQLCGEDKNTTIIDGYECTAYIDADNVHITGFTIQDGWYGVLVNMANNITITGNIFCNNNYNIQLRTSSYVIISDNEFTDSYLCITLLGASHNSIVKNTVRGWQDGIWMVSSSYNIVSQNNIMGGKHGEEYGGIGVQLSNHNTITQNYIMNYIYGITVIHTSKYNTITDNLLFNNDYGVCIPANYFGYYSAYDNLFYHNEFILNGINAEDSGRNNWSNTMLQQGNYWSDFDEPCEGAWDNDSNGIIDKPYIIPPGENTDDYPLITPNTPIPGFYVRVDGPSKSPTGEWIQFKGSVYGGVRPYNWSWDFGNGDVSYEQNPMYKYSAAGVYTVSLTVTDSEGNVSEDHLSIRLFEPFRVDVHGPYRGVVSTPIQFISSPNGGVPGYDWYWDFGDGHNGFESRDQNPLHTYNQPGVYIVKLMIVDSIWNYAYNNTTATITIVLPDTHGPYTGIPGNPIQFTGSVQGGTAPFSWLWAFGDGNTSTLQNPTHIYLHTGVFPVSLTVIDNLHNTANDTTKATITMLNINTHGPYNGCSNKPVQFTGSVQGGTAPFFWLWAFGDGNTSTLQNPTHIYLHTGTYTVTLTVTDNVNITENDTTTATIILDVNVHGSYYGFPNTSIQFTGSVDGGIAPYSWFWDFGDGYTSTLQNPTHIYLRDNFYTVSLKVTDSINNVGINTTYANIHFIIDAHGPYNGIPGEPIQFNGSAEGGVEPYSWLWDFGDGGTSNLQNPIHIYYHTGVYPVNFTVTDSLNNRGQFQTTATIAITTLIVNAHGPYTGLPGEPVQFIGSAEGGVKPYHWRWDFNDGSFTDEQNPLHVYLRTGVYTVILTVTDSRGTTASDTTTATITIHADAHGPYTGLPPGEPVQFTGSVDGGFSPYTWLWDFGDGTNSTLQNPSHTYMQSGVYTVTLTVIDSVGNRGTDSTTALIKPVVVSVDGTYNSSTPGWGCDHFASIQDGINMVADYGTVNVHQGVYYEHIIIDKTLCLVGEDKDTTIIDGGLVQNVNILLVTAGEVRISGFTIRHCRLQGHFHPDPPQSAIMISNSSGLIVVTGNIIIDNDYGISIGGSSNNIIYENDFINNNNFGVYITKGLEDFPGDFVPSDNNLIYHNNFINNGVSAYDKNTNFWNSSYPFGGNYWSGYTGSDAFHGPNQDIPGGDGIGDTPYLMPGGNSHDSYPLMHRFILGDVNNDGAVTFADIDPFVAALGTTPETFQMQHPMWSWLAADCNQDGRITFADIDPFVQLLGQ